MARLARLLVMAVLMVVVGGCSTTFWVDWDTGRDFSGYQTFAWFELPPPPGRSGPPAAPNAIVAARIRSSVEGEMINRGLRPDAAADADVLVTYHIALRRGVRVFHSGWGWPYYGCCWGHRGGFSTATSYTEGTLIVDVLDGSTRSLVWRGIADGAFGRPNPSDEKVDKVVARLMRSFPP
jgi:hypothetical protein